MEGDIPGDCLVFASSVMRENGGSVVWRLEEGGWWGASELRGANGLEQEEQ